MSNLTHAELLEMFDYNPDSGNFVRRRTTAHNAKAGDIAGSRLAGGYLAIRIGRTKNYYCHRLAWFYMTGDWPTHEIDHINGNKSDNRYANLRQATTAQNQSNRGAPRHNTSGFKGVIFFPQTGKWNARIKSGGRRYSLGYFLTPEAAHAAYKAAAEKVHGEFANAGTVKKGVRVA